MFDFFISGEPMAASQTFSSPTNRQTFPRRPGVDHFILFTSALATTHNPTLLLIVVANNYHTRYWVVKEVMRNSLRRFGDNLLLLETPNPKHQTLEKLQAANPKTSAANGIPDRGNCKMRTPCGRNQAEPFPHCHQVELDAWNFFGAWNLELGASNRACSKPSSP
ncbi:MAG: hypothetical protein L0Z50_24295 [Verrucomicrobiales bacterium]|nr:hypothetical protein [Verrucomicrobiales bacterium]